MFSKTLLSVAALLFVPAVLACSNGSYKTGISTCTPCPAGTYDTHNGQGTGVGSCTSCSAGTFSSATGATSVTTCKACTAGTFSESGSATCCECCAGFYSGGSAGSCTKCPSPVHPYSPPGSSSPSDCQAAGIGKQPVGTCSIGGDNRCPAIVPSGPEGSSVKKRRDIFKCTRGYTTCPIMTGRNGFECVDTKNDAEMCGGCVGPDGEGEGRDCTTIPGINMSRCVRSRCVIDSCRKGYKMSFEGDSCIPVSRLGIQQSGEVLGKRML